MALKQTLLISAISFAVTVGILEVTLRIAFAPYVVSIYELDERCLFRVGPDRRLPGAADLDSAVTVPRASTAFVLRSAHDRAHRRGDHARRDPRVIPVMHELRPHLSESDFVAQVGRQRAAGYRVAFLRDAGTVVCVAGFHVVEMLAFGRAIYVDDLVSTAARRSSGHGAAMLEWLVDRARAEGCSQLQLDSGVQRHGAHRFYLRHRMDIVSYHFA